MIVFLIANVTFTESPKDVHCQLEISPKIFMRCSVHVEGDRTPLVRWRLSGAEYTPSTLPDRFNSNTTGLSINPVTHDDDGLTVQCYVLLVDLPHITARNSSIGVIHVLNPVAASANQTLQETNQAKPTEITLYTSGASSTKKENHVAIILCVTMIAAMTLYMQYNV